jgi:hypothetical protein
MLKILVNKEAQLGTSTLNGRSAVAVAGGPATFSESRMGPFRKSGSMGRNMADKPAPTHDRQL